MRFSILAGVAAATLSSFALPSLALADCQSEIVDLMKRSQASGPFRTEATVTLTGGAAKGGETKLIVEMNPPKAYRSRNTKDGVTTEMIMLDSKVWMNEGQGWKESPPEIAKAVAGSATKMQDAVLASIREPQCLGSQTVDGTSYTAYSFKSEMAGMKADTKLYADPARKLPVRSEMSGEAMGMKTRSVMRWTFDPSITIKAPM